MKKIIVLSLCAFLMGCSSPTSSADPGKNDSTPEAVPEKTPEPTPESTPEPTPEVTPPPEDWRGFLDGDPGFEKYTYENLDVYVPETMPLTGVEIEGYDCAWGGNDLYVFATRIEKEKLKEAGVATKEDVFSKGMPDIEYVKDGNKYWYQYDNDVNDVPYRYVYVLLEDDTYFWDFNAAVKSGNSEEDDMLLQAIVSRLDLR